MTNHATRSDLIRALLDSASTSATPEAVLRSSDLSKEQKLEILRRWACDALETAVAEGEGRSGGESSRRDAVMKKHSTVSPAAQRESADGQPSEFASSPCYMHEPFRYK